MYSNHSQVVRHVSGATYKTVHEFKTTVTQTGIQHILTNREPWVQAGDIIGLYTGAVASQRMVPHDRTTCTSLHRGVLYLKHTLPLPTTMALSETNCRTYSIMAEYIREYHPLDWRHNGRDSVSNHQPHDCLHNCVFRRRSSSVSLAFVRGIHRGPVNSPHKWPVTRQIFHLMTSSRLCTRTKSSLHIAVCVT